MLLWMPNTIKRVYGSAVGLLLALARTPPTPTRRIYGIEHESRVYAIPAESRVYAIPAKDD